MKRDIIDYEYFITTTDPNNDECLLTRNLELKRDFSASDILSNLFDTHETDPQYSKEYVLDKIKDKKFRYTEEFDWQKREPLKYGYFVPRFKIRPVEIMLSYF